MANHRPDTSANIAHGAADVISVSRFEMISKSNVCSAKLLPLSIAVSPRLKLLTGREDI